MQKIWTWLFIGLWSLASADVAAQVDRIELGYQTTKRGIVWFRPGLPTHVPYWQFSRDTNAVMWHDTLTSIRYDWDYSDDRWRAKGTFSGPLPPPAQATSGSTLIDYRTAYWMRDTFNLLHKYDSTANAWTPWGDWFYLSAVPTDITATVSNGAAKYRRSLWQDSDDFVVYHWNGSAWVPFTGDGSETIVTAGTGISVTGAGTTGSPYVVTNTGDLSSTNELQTLANTSNANTHTATLSNSGGSIQLVEGANVTLTTTGTALDGIVTIAATSGSGTDLSFSGASSPVTLNSSTGTDVTVTAGTGISLSATSGNITITNTVTNTDAQNLTIEGAGPTYDVAISGGTDVTIQGGGIVTLSESPANTLIVTATEVDGSITNEGSLTVGAGGANTSTIVSNTSGSTPVTISGGGIVTVTESGSTITVSATETDGSVTNELQTYGHAGTTTYTNTLSNGGGSFTLQSSGIVSLSHTAGTTTISATEVDGSVTNELQTYGHAGTTTYTNTLSNGGGSFTLQAAGIATISHSAGTTTITATEVDGSVSNELQTLSNTSNSTTHTATLSNSGGSIQLAEGTGIALATTGTALDGIVTVSSTITQANGAETIVTAGTGIGVSGIGTSGNPYIVSNTGDLSATNEIQRLDTFEIVSNTLRASLLNDAVPFSSVSLAPYLDNTDDQKIDTFAIVSNVLRLSVESDGEPFKSVNLAPYLDNTDAQTLSIDSTTVTAGQRFALSITGGNTVYFEDEDRQQVDTFRVNSGNVELSIQRDAQPVKTIPVTSIAPVQAIAAGTGISVSGTSTVTVTNTGDLSNTNEIQQIDTFTIVSNVLRASLSSDGVPFKSVDLTPYVNEATNLTYSGASSPVTLNSSTGTDVTHTAGTGISLSATSGNMTITNTAPDQTVTITNGGGVAVSGTYPAFTLTATDQSTTNELQTIANTSAATTHTATLSNSGGSLQLAEGSGVTLTTTGTALDGIVTIAATDPSITNEGSLTVAAGTGTTSIINSNTSGSTGVTIEAGTGLSISETGNTITLTNTGDLSATNELQTYGHAGATTYTNTLSNGGGSFSVTGAGINVVSQTAGAVTITGTEVDGSVTNEGVLGVGAGSGTSSTLLSSTSGANAVTINAAGILAISESTSANGGSITLTATEADGSTTNELQTLANASAATTHTVTLSNSGGSVQFVEGTGVTLTTTGTALDGIVTISASDDSGGIYGDGTPTSGNDTLPGGGSVVTIPDDYSPLKFLVNSDPINPVEIPVIEVSTSHCGDDTYVNYLEFKTPLDSFKIQSFDCGTILRAQSGQLTLFGEEEIILSSDSISMTTVPDKTTLGGIIGFTQFGSYLSQIKGTATDQVLKWNNTGAGYWYPGTAGGGTLNGAENGLSVVADKVRLGGNLITAATSIEGDGNELRFFDGKLSVSSWTGYANSPVQPIRFQAAEADPTLNSTPTLDGIIEYRVHNSGGSDQSNSMTIGGYSNDADGVWMQSRSAAVPNVKYPLSLQPRGGLFSVGRVGGLDALATFAGSALTGGTITGNVMHLENTGGNAKAAMGMGVGTDVLDSEIGFFDAADALRITNRNAATGTSSVRIAVGGETSDKVIVTGSSVTPNARMGVGHTATTTIKSTIDNKGSYAAAINATTGNLTLTEAHHTVRYTLNSSPTFTLPSAFDCPGREYIIHHFGSAGQITLSQNVISSTGTTFNSIPARNWAYIQSDGSDWYGYRLQSL